MRVSVVLLLLGLTQSQLIKGQNVWTDLKQLRENMVEQKVRLQIQIEDLQKENAALKVSLAFTEQEIKSLKEEKASIFTAPVKGVYYFRYTMSGHSHTHWTTVRLVKNQQSVVVATKPPKGDHDYAASGATLLLEKGDVVYLKLVANSHLWDNNDNHFSFSGFLLFPM